MHQCKKIKSQLDNWSNLTDPKPLCKNQKYFTHNLFSASNSKNLSLLSQQSLLLCSVTPAVATQLPSPKNHSSSGHKNKVNPHNIINILPLMCRAIITNRCQSEKQKKCNKGKWDFLFNYYSNELLNIGFIMLHYCKDSVLSFAAG